MSDRSESAGPPPGLAPARRPFALRRALLSLAVGIMGLVDVLSALLSHPPERLLALRRVVPTEVLDTSRTFTLLAGALLLLTAWGLRRGKRRAFVFALLLCAVSVPVNLLKAADIEEATVAVALMFALGTSASAFTVESAAFGRRGLGRATLFAALALALYAVGGTWIVKEWTGHDPSLRRAFAEAGERLFGIGSPVTIVPRTLPAPERRVVEWYLRSLPLLSFVFVLGAAFAALRPVAHSRRHRSEAGRVAELLRVHGDSTVASFALEDDTDYFFSVNGRAVIAYRFESDVLLGIGDPIGPDEELPALLDDFARWCERHDWSFAFFQARPDRLPQYRARGWRALHVGEDPVLNLDRFTLEGAAVGDVRRAVAKAERAGLTVEHFHPERRSLDPAGADRATFDALHEISQAWLRARAGGEAGFCMGRFDARRLAAAWLAIARGPDGRIEGFVTWEPVWARRGWALDLMRRRADSAPGTMELLVVRSAEEARSRGDERLSLSLSALANVAEPGAASGAESLEPSALGGDSERTREFLRQHLARFYDFEGLFRWKRKFAPSFEDRYLVIPSLSELPRVALALVRAQSPGGLSSYWASLRPRPADPGPAPPAPDAHRESA